MSTPGQGAKWNEPTAPGVIRGAVVVVQRVTAWCVAVTFVSSSRTSLQSHASVPEFQPASVGACARLHLAAWRGQQSLWPSVRTSWLTTSGVDHRRDYARLAETWRSSSAKRAPGAWGSWADLLRVDVATRRAAQLPTGTGRLCPVRLTRVESCQPRGWQTPSVQRSTEGAWNRQVARRCWSPAPSFREALCTSRLPRIGSQPHCYASLLPPLGETSGNTI